MKQRLKRMYFRLRHTAAETCAQFGHRLHTYRATGYMKAEWSWSVADAFEKLFFTCKCCGAELGSKIVECRGLNGLTMDSESWSKLRRNGLLITNNERVW